MDDIARVEQVVRQHAAQCATTQRFGRAVMELAARPQTPETAERLADLDERYRQHQALEAMYNRQATASVDAALAAVEDMRL